MMCDYSFLVVLTTNCRHSRPHMICAYGIWFSEVPASASPLYTPIDASQSQSATDLIDQISPYSSGMKFSRTSALRYQLFVLALLYCKHVYAGTATYGATVARVTIYTGNYAQESKLRVQFFFQRTISLDQCI